MSLLDVIDGLVVPGLVLLADWSIRWGVLLAVLLFWLAFLPPRRAATRYLLGIIVLAAGMLLPAMPRWANIAILWPSRTPKPVQPERPDPAAAIESMVTRAEITAADGPTPPRIALRATSADRTPRAAASLPLGRWRWTALAVASAWTFVVLMLTCRLVGGMAAVTVRGRVLDAAGAPVAGATIVGVCEGNICKPFPGQERVTAPRGEFQLPEGGYNTVAKGKPARLLIRLKSGVEHEASTVPSDDGVVTVKLPLARVSYLAMVTDCKHRSAKDLQRGRPIP